MAHSSSGKHNFSIRLCNGKDCNNSIASTNIFAATSDDPPPSNIRRRSDHPVSRSAISADTTGPLHTNKFYANFFLSEQASGTWTHPYSLSWASGSSGAAQSRGLAISHIDRSQFVFGDTTAHNSSRYFFAPLGIQSLILSAGELSSSTTLRVSAPTAMSANITLAADGASLPLITFPLVQGMAYVTGVYHNATPLVESSVYFRSVEGPVKLHPSSNNNSATIKYRALLEDGRTWLIYASPAPGSGYPVLALANTTRLSGPSGWNGAISVAKLPVNGTTDDEAIYDSAAGVYPVGAEVFGSASGSTGTYGFNFTRGGYATSSASPLLMFALPHHAASFDASTAGGRTSVTLATTTKGYAVAYRGDAWTMREALAADLGFAPYSAAKGQSVTALSAGAACAVIDAAAAELAQDVGAQTALDSMYFSGKALAKFAAVVYAANDLGGSAELAAEGLKKLKAAFAVFVDNRQPNPLVYDEVWGGVVSNAGYADANADFGNSYYNDHHFHYGYFIYTAAVIGYLDPTWLAAGTNKAWTNMLARDFASPVQSSHYPSSRSFDWFHGHSWAKGLFSSGDGKDQESSSEDAFASYALKMWGKVTGDAAMEARGALMLAIQARSFQSYFLMTCDNTIQPREIINNKVSGVLFENKVDWATYFGDKWYYKEGIHMIPVHVPSALIRTAEFVAEEYDTYMSGRRIDEAEGGWRGILQANLALVDAKEAYDYFASANFSTEYLDGGASRTWYLAYTAALAGL
ncbi:endo-1,3-beta-glucanase [Macrophomina phaseolina]|uniref:glucan endo-1,3-beta-D-glucosidase n=1 Tax=Macrophomina phaseolina TaxID=35725 RepID=A0ABQ8GPX2_9PEZI|nr:endo-1,3-beta-glucanase [Macrophomina phaseolina]